MSEMTSRERTDLISLCKQRAKLAKDMAGYRAADLLADFEAQLATEYAFDDDETWREANKIATDALTEANEMIAERCRELGVPTRFAPSLAYGWSSRGENDCAGRRAELRKVATSRLDAMTKRAKVQIDSASLEVQTYLISEGLTSAAAQQFLETSMPTVEDLMPVLAVPEIEKLLGRGDG